MSFKFLDSFSPMQIGIGLTALQCIVAVPVVKQMQKKAESRSAFSTTSTTSTTDTELTLKIANLVMYGPSAALAYYKAQADVATKIPMLLVAHFGKKAVELFITEKKLSPGEEEEMVPASIAVQTGTFYCVGTYVLLNDLFPTPQGVSMGQVIFWMGQIGNALHSALVEQKKKSSGGNKSRELPDAGLYQFNIAAPRQLCEIVSWLGIASCAKSTSGYVQAALVAGVLAVQAKKINDSLPVKSRAGTKRWNLIPYIY